MKIKLLRKIFEYALVICIIVEFNTTYLVFPIVKRCVQILPAFLLLALVLMTKCPRSKVVVYFVALYMACAIPPLLVLNNGVYMSYIKGYVVILPLFWIYLYQRKQMGISRYLSVFYRYSNAMVGLGSISVVMWLLCSIMKRIPITHMFPYAWGPDVTFIPSYYDIYFETQQIFLFGEATWRNTGIFNEGPMYNMVLCVALSIEYFMRPARSKLRIVILVTTIISTFTTTGQLFLVSLLGWHIFTKVGSRHRILMIISVPIILFLINVAGGILMDAKTEVGGEGSVFSRTQDILTCIDVGLSNPLLGVGIISADDMQLWHGRGYGYSNSLFTVFAKGGIYFLLLYIVALLIIPIKYYLNYKNKQWLLTMLFFFFLFTITISYDKYLTLFFIAWGLSNIELQKWHRSRNRL